MASASPAHQVFKDCQELTETQDPREPRATEVSLVCKDFQDRQDPRVTRAPWATMVSTASRVNRVLEAHLATTEQQAGLDSWDRLV